MNHLTDEQLQNHLEGASNASLGAHLQNCARCQNQLAFYKMMFAELRSDAPFEFSGNLAQAVISKIESAEEKRTDLIESGLMAAAVLVGLVLTAYYTNLKDLSGFYVPMVERLLDYAKNLSVFGELSLRSLSSSGSIFVLTVLILAVGSGLDYVLTRHKFSLK
jgi:hypothetical protein